MSVENAIDSNATETIAAIVASDSVTAEHGILFVDVFVCLFVDLFVCRCAFAAWFVCAADAFLYLYSLCGSLFLFVLFISKNEYMLLYSVDG